MEKYSPIVSVIIPVYNEERYIRRFLTSVINQSFSKEKMEIFIIDGCSTDNTMNIVREFDLQYPNLFVCLKNEYHTVPFALNMGISHAKGKYIIRMDAHAEFPPEYIQRCVDYLSTKNYDNVGGHLVTVGEGFIGETIAMLFSSKFGVGSCQFRTGNQNGFVETVPYGAFPKELFNRIGKFNTHLTRTQDLEMNLRIKKNGGKVFLAKDIYSKYYCRSSLKKMIKYALTNGYWSIKKNHVCAGLITIRHLVPLIFLSSIIIFSILFFIHPFFQWMLILELSVYFLLDLYFTYQKTFHSIRQFPLLFLLFPIFHLSYGCGALTGLLCIPFQKLTIHQVN